MGRRLGESPVTRLRLTATTRPIVAVHSVLMLVGTLSPYPLGPELGRTTRVGSGTSLGERRGG
jgi:hypothetical protein